MENDRSPTSGLRGSHDSEQSDGRRHSNSSMEITPMPVPFQHGHDLISPGEPGGPDTPQADDHDGQLFSPLETAHESEEDDRSGVHDGKEENRPFQPWIRLNHSGYVFLLAFVYAGLATFAWVVTCILVHRPIGTSLKQYGERQRPVLCYLGLVTHTFHRCKIRWPMDLRLGSRARL